MEYKGDICPYCGQGIRYVARSEFRQHKKDCRNLFHVRLVGGKLETRHGLIPVSHRR